MKVSIREAMLMETFARYLRVLLEDCVYRKIEVESYMPLTIETIPQGKDEECISLSHLGEQNGDVMRDPEVVFKMVRSGLNGEFAVPCYYRNDYAGAEFGDYWGQDITKIMTDSMLGSRIDLCELWFTNLRHQGFFDERQRRTVYEMLKVDNQNVE